MADKKSGSGLETGLSSTEKFDRSSSQPPTNDKTHRPTDNGFISKSKGGGFKK